MSELSRLLDPIPALKEQVAAALVQALDGLSQEVAAGRTRLTRARIHEIRAGKLEDFSLQRLVRCLYRIGCQVEITVLSSHEVSIRELRERSAQRAALVNADRERIRALREKRRQRRDRPG